MKSTRFWALADSPVPSSPQAGTFAFKQCETVLHGPDRALPRTISVPVDFYELYYNPESLE